MQACKSYIESISLVDKTLHTEVVANIVISTLSALQSQGSSVVSWQQVELALHLVYTFAEVLKSERPGGDADLRQYSCRILRTPS